MKRKIGIILLILSPICFFIGFRTVYMLVTYPADKNIFGFIVSISGFMGFTLGLIFLIVGVVLYRKQGKQEKKQEM